MAQYDSSLGNAPGVGQNTNYKTVSQMKTAEDFCGLLATQKRRRLRQEIDWRLNLAYYRGNQYVYWNPQAKRIGFRTAHGLSERVIYRELFPSGLTLLDKGQLGELGTSHLVARQELRELVARLHLPGFGNRAEAA